MTGRELNGNLMWVNGEYYPIAIKRKTEKGTPFSLEYDYTLSPYFGLCPKCAFMNKDWKFELCAREKPDCNVCGNLRFIPTKAIPLLKGYHFEPVQNGWIAKENKVE